MDWLNEEHKQLLGEENVNNDYKKIRKSIKYTRILIPQTIMTSKKLLLGIITTFVSLYLLMYVSVRFYGFNYDNSGQYKDHQPPFVYNESGNYLIDTPGCYIPNYTKSMVFNEAKKSYVTCGKRAVFIELISDDSIEFIVDEDKLEKYESDIDAVHCCYQFAERSSAPGKEDEQLIYSRCTDFFNGTVATLKSEVITVTCTSEKSKKKSNEVYKDSYLILKKINSESETYDYNNNYWNVMIIGLDTMSRARVQRCMPKTISYLRNNKWLDFRGYQKVASNTFPNLMALFAGKNESSAYKNCGNGMSSCNHLMMWSHYHNAGYITAYGEDFIRLPDTFHRNKGYKIQPTDHYIRPFFLTGESQEGNLLCTGKRPSALQLLDYASNFANAYKNEKFFSLFWLNSYSHNTQNLPTLLDDDMVKFMNRLNASEVLQNTFVIFLSDHGIRFGQTRQSIEAFYEERLPMMFMHIPDKFRQMYPEEYINLIANKNRLVTPYDLHATLWHILKLSNDSVIVNRGEACPQCSSLLYEQSSSRTCSDANVDQKWCTCRKVISVPRSNIQANQCLQIAVTYIQSKPGPIKTKPCTICSPLKLKSVLRMHVDTTVYQNKTIYIIAFKMTPGDMTYEATVETNGYEFNILPPTQTISPYNSNGNCVKRPIDREYCVCSVLKNCNKKHHKSN